MTTHWYIAKLCMNSEPVYILADNIRLNISGVGESVEDAIKNIFEDFPSPEAGMEFWKKVARRLHYKHGQPTRLTILVTDAFKYEETLYYPE